jgi:hypothetical protein
MHPYSFLGVLLLI